MSLGRWVAIAILAALGLFGLTAAAGAASGAAYWLGLASFAAAVLLILRVVQGHFDRWPHGELFDMWPQRPGSLWLLLALLTVLGLIGLNAAASDDAGLHWFGLGLFGGCAVLAIAAAGQLVDAVSRRRPGAGSGAHGPHAAHPAGR